MQREEGLEMCTAIAIRGKDGFYFGRNMDIYYPMEFETARIDGGRGFEFSCGRRLCECKSVIGTAVVSGGYPLYADAMNGSGLCMAGLEFPGLACYGAEESSDKTPVSPYEFIPWILTQCSSVSEAEELISHTRLVKRDFSESLPLTPLHWMLADGERSIVVESVKEGVKVYRCDCNVLTNAPEYPFHAVNLRQYAKLTPDQPEGDGVFGAPFSSGFGAIGLPGDFSSASRFIKAAFLAESVSAVTDGYGSGATELLRALLAVAVPRGAVKTREGKNNATAYTSCMDVSEGKYYRVPYDLSFCLDGVGRSL